MGRSNETIHIYSRMEELMQIMLDYEVLRSTKRAELDRFARYMWLLGKSNIQLQRREDKFRKLDSV